MLCTISTNFVAFDAVLISACGAAELPWRALRPTRFPDRHGAPPAPAAVRNQSMRIRWNARVPAPIRRPTASPGSSASATPSADPRSSVQSGQATGTSATSSPVATRTPRRRIGELVVTDHLEFIQSLSSTSQPAHRRPAVLWRSGSRMGRSSRAATRSIILVVTAQADAAVEAGRRICVPARRGRIGVELGTGSPALPRQQPDRFVSGNDQRIGHVLMLLSLFSAHSRASGNAAEDRKSFRSQLGPAFRGNGGPSS